MLFCNKKRGGSLSCKQTRSTVVYRCLVYFCKEILNVCRLSCRALQLLPVEQLLHTSACLYFLCLTLAHVFADTAAVNDGLTMDIIIPTTSRSHASKHIAIVSGHFICNIHVWSRVIFN